MDQRMPTSIIPIGGGHGRPFSSPDFDVGEYGCEIAEYRVEGIAVSYEFSGARGRISVAGGIPGPDRLLATAYV